MRYIFLNLKRFDIPSAFGGLNRIAPIEQWGGWIVRQTQERLRGYTDMEFVMFFPEAHLLSAAAARDEGGVIQLGCQSVYRDDTAPGGNFGAFTTNRPAAAATALGCGWTIIGHCEERRDKAELLALAGAENSAAINQVLGRQVKAALDRGLRVLYCVGESAREQDRWETVLRDQLRLGLKQADPERICIAYEPVWAIGPGKTPPDRDYIEKVARFIKRETGGLPVVYGGGLKTDNAAMLASIPEVDGGLIALTRFTGEIGFYPDEYLSIIETYRGGL